MAVQLDVRQFVLLHIYNLLGVNWLIGESLEVMDLLVGVKDKKGLAVLV